MKIKVGSVILAAGEGKRMQSNNPKVMSLVNEKPMLYHVVKACNSFGIENICVVTGFKHEVVDDYIKEEFPNVKTALQEKRLGTAHAVICAKDFLKKSGCNTTFVLNGDAPFIDAKTLEKAYKLHTMSQNSATVISSKIENPTGYGRIIRDKITNEMKYIIEQKDANEEELKVNEVNSGAYVFNTNDLLNSIDKIKNDNAQGEFYLTDIISLFKNQGKNINAVVSDNPYTVMGANNLEQLEVLNKIAKGILK